MCPLHREKALSFAEESKDNPVKHPKTSKPYSSFSNRTYCVLGDGPGICVSEMEQDSVPVLPGLTTLGETGKHSAPEAGAHLAQGTLLCELSRGHQRPRAAHSYSTSLSHCRPSKDDRDTLLEGWALGVAKMLLGMLRSPIRAPSFEYWFPIPVSC